MKKIELTLAGWPERLFAYLLDTIILLGLLMLASAILTALHLLSSKNAYVAVFFGNLLYHTLSTGSFWQCTPGQRLMNLYVIHQNGTALSMPQALERFLVFYMPLLPMYASFIAPETAPAITTWLGMLWFLPIIINARRTGVHDRICNTRVVVGRKVAL